MINTLPQEKSKTLTQLSTYKNQLSRINIDALQLKYNPSNRVKFKLGTRKSKY